MEKVTNILYEIIFTDVYMLATYVVLRCAFLSTKWVALSCLLQMNTNQIDTKITMKTIPTLLNDKYTLNKTDIIEFNPIHKKKITTIVDTPFNTNYTNTNYTNKN